MPRVTRRVGGKLQTAEERARPDYGTNGLAMKARASRVIETKDAGVLVRVMDPAYPLDRYEAAALLTERQIFALRRLQIHYAIGFGFPKLVPSDPAGSLSEDRAERQTVARRAYGEAMALVPPRSQAPISNVVRSEWPKVIDALLLIRIGADAVADHWRMPRVVTGKLVE